MRPASTFPVYAFLKALQMVENPTQTHKPGTHGELGRLQMRADTWNQHTTLLFNDANVWANEEGVAIKHVRWLEAHLRARKLAVTPYRMALAWNAGLEGSLQADAAKLADGYACRVSRLTEECL